MEVIYKGKTLEQKNWYGCCGKCNSTVKAKQEELMIKKFLIWKRWIGNCPVCGYPIKFNPEMSSWDDDLFLD